MHISAAVERHVNRRRPIVAIHIDAPFKKAIAGELSPARSYLVRPMIHNVPSAPGMLDSVI